MGRYHNCPKSLFQLKLLLFWKKGPASALNVEVIVSGRMEPIELAEKEPLAL